MTTVQFLAATALFDAIIAAITWMAVHSRQKTYSGPPLTIVRYFKKNLAWTIAFLLFTAAALMLFEGTAQAISVILSNLSLWVALYYIILIVSVGHSSAGKNVAMIGFLIMAALGTLYRILGLFNVTVDFGTVANYVLANMSALLMYAVWLPGALVFFVSALRVSEMSVRVRFVLFAIGLVLITVSWAWRLLIVEPSLFVVTITSLLGFFSLLSGVVYGHKAATAPHPAPTRM